MRRKEDAKISLAGRNKYNFRELSASFRYVSRVSNYSYSLSSGLRRIGEPAKVS